MRQLAAGFRNWGVRPDQQDAVCIHAFNDIMYPMLFLGIIAAGGIFVGSNPSYTPYELAHGIRVSDTKFIITEPEMLQSTKTAAKECNIPQANILIFNVLGQSATPGNQSWEWLLGHGEVDWPRFDDLESAKITQAARLFSSGTTGLPKSAIWSHYNLVAEHHLIRDEMNKDYAIRRLHSLPMFHAATVPIALTSALKSGHTCFVMRRFELEPFLSNIQKYQINDLGMVPPIVIATINSPITRKYSLRSLKRALCGAAPLDKGPQKRFQELMGENAPFTQVFGRWHILFQIFHPLRIAFKG